eukprot:TRINITY_DN20839_c0_g1_i1.p1 TRINITY_DN20839_c0_g1~~TRINITY_DN20839_c0_g1_i1.p1  ORF type:complete len:290 (+),score=60.11 TRINITY_DN20839_c0_g1_i1:30-872(+)
MNTTWSGGAWKSNDLGAWPAGSSCARSSSSSLLPRVAPQACSAGGADPYHTNGNVTGLRYSPKSATKAVDLPHLASTAGGPVVRGGQAMGVCFGPASHKEDTSMNGFPAALRKSLGFDEQGAQANLMDSKEDNWHLRAGGVSFSRARCTSLPGLHPGSEQPGMRTHEMQQLQELQQLQQLLQQQSAACGAAAEALLQRQACSSGSKPEWLQTPFQQELSSQSAPLLRPPVPPEPDQTVSKPASPVKSPAQPQRMERKPGSSSCGCGRGQGEVGQAPSLGR